MDRGAHLNSKLVGLGGGASSDERGRRQRHGQGESGEKHGERSRCVVREKRGGRGRKAVKATNGEWGEMGRRSERNGKGKAGVSLCLFSGGSVAPAR